MMQRMMRATTIIWLAPSRRHAVTHEAPDVRLVSACKIAWLRDPCGQAAAMQRRCSRHAYLNRRRFLPCGPRHASFSHMQHAPTTMEAR